MYCCNVVITYDVKYPGSCVCTVRVQYTRIHTVGDLRVVHVLHSCMYVVRCGT